ncbi:MAG TPA: magnesium transporter [Salinivirgaceae bacterium]|nr:magnesium transporter [Salinivirgaceae bacterium]HQA75828.1 magnesium transporter [Salinivirgaceae bacterium]
MVRRLYIMVEQITDFHELIENKEWKTLKKELTLFDAFQIAEFIEELDEDDDIIMFRLLSREQAKETFQHLPHRNQERIVEGLAKNVRTISSLLNDLDPDDRTAFLEELPGTITQRLIQLLSPEERKIATKLLGYPEDSIGRLMTPEYVAIKEYYTVDQALSHIRKYGRDSETLNVIYIVDDDWRLIDDIRIKEIILASPDQAISDIVDHRFVSLNAYDDQEVAIGAFQDYDRVALPVTDTNGVLLGIITFDDVMDIAEEESTEDFHKFGSIQDAIINPLKATVAHLYKKRVLWLTALVFMNVFSGAAISNFENVIETTVSLVFFLPLLIGSGGNAGAQSATLMIRSLATGDVKMNDWARLLGKELIVSLLLGITMGVGVVLIALFRSPEIILVVSLTMVLTVITGSLIGLLLPFVFTKFKLDPATASAPLITSIADICGVMIYFSIATWYFGL